MAKILYVLLAALLMPAVLAAITGPSSNLKIVKRQSGDDLTDYTGDQANDDEQNDDGDWNDPDDPDEVEDNLPNPMIVTKSRRMRTPKGEPVWLPCEIDNLNENTVVEWKRGDDGMIYLGNSRSVADTRFVLHGNKTLSITSVTEQDSGVYTCLVVGGNEVHHQLEVYTPQPPRIIKMTPQEKYVQTGSSLEITCDATGEPKPKISWRKENKDRSEVLTSADVEFRSNSVFIANVKRQHQGRYVCLADNNIGKPALSSLPIIVVGEPRVHVHKSVINGDIGAEAILTCQAHEEPQSNIKWLKDNVEIETSQDKEVETVGQKSTLTINSIREEDFGTYTCQAMNQYGNHSRSVQLIKEPVLEDLKGEGPSITFNIHSHAPLKYVEIQYRKIGSDENEMSAWKASPAQWKQVEKHRYRVQHNIDNLEPGKYEARIRASNSYGFTESPNAVYFEGAYSDNQQIRQAGVFGSSSAINRAGMLATLSSIVCMAVMRLILF